MPGANPGSSGLGGSFLQVVILAVFNTMLAVPGPRAPASGLRGLHRRSGLVILEGMLAPSWQVSPFGRGLPRSEALAFETRSVATMTTCKDGFHVVLGFRGGLEPSLAFHESESCHILEGRLWHPRRPVWVGGLRLWALMRCVKASWKVGFGILVGLFGLEA